MRRFSSSLACLALALAAPPVTGCSGSNGGVTGNDAGTDGDAGMGTGANGDAGAGAVADGGGGSSHDAGDGYAEGGGASSASHALGTIMLAESHAPGGGGTTQPLLLASFLPDAATVSPTCSSQVAGCDFVSVPQCGQNGSACAVGSTCGWDTSCHATCMEACTLQCGAGQECYFPSPNQPACRASETFDAGTLTFAGTTTPITLFPPYSYQGAPGAPFLPGSQIEVKASGATGPGFDKFDETFMATTFLQTNPPLDTLASATVFGAGTVPIDWAPGTDSVKITGAGAGGVATCAASDSSGHFDIPRAAVTSALGQAGTASVAIDVTRERDEWRKSESTHGSLTTGQVQPVGWLELTTASTESHSFLGCASAQTMCPDGCFDTSSDPYHCGSCTAVCSATQTCESGQCVP
jgi:hypothetical protein